MSRLDRRPRNNFYLNVKHNQQQTPRSGNFLHIGRDGERQTLVILTYTKEFNFVNVKYFGIFKLNVLIL